MLEAKEGLSLINGTQYMTALGALALLDAEDAARLADIAGAMSLEALKGTPRAFDPRIHAVRPHPGQATSARNLRALLADSGIVESHKDCGKVQDPYSLRCMPQVHGATRDALAYARRVLEREAASRPTTRSSSPTTQRDDLRRQLPRPAGRARARLRRHRGRRAGQHQRAAHRAARQPAPVVGAAAVPRARERAQLRLHDRAGHGGGAGVSENKVLAHPASVDSIPSSAGREDHVSMGVHAADKLARIVDNVRNVLAIELLCAAQGVDLRAPHRPGPALDAAHTALRARVATLETDRVVSTDRRDRARAARRRQPRRRRASAHRARIALWYRAARER